MVEPFQRFSDSPGGCQYHLRKRVGSYFAEVSPNGLTHPLTQVVLTNQIAAYTRLKPGVNEMKNIPMKRVLISLGAGLLIIPMLLGLILIVKIVSPNDYPPAFMWLLIWPLPLLRLLSRLTYLEVTAGRVMLFGLLGDYLFSSFLAYLSLTVRGRFLKRKGRVSPLPPPPAPFTD